MLYLRLIDPGKADTKAPPGPPTLVVPLPSWKLGWPDTFKAYLTAKAALLTKGTNVYIVSPTP